jgi:hypothetical protein
MLHLVRVWIRAKDPESFVELGNPKFSDSNLGSTYWKFQGFVSWRHFSDTGDGVLHALCLLTTLGQLAGAVLFVMQFWVVPSSN